MQKYDARFFDYVDSGAIRSAERFVQVLMPELRIKTMIDVGCGRGGWAGEWKSGGCEAVLGIDGDYVDQDSLYIDKKEFKVVDLNKPFYLGNRFDLVQSLEVAEHLHPSVSEAFVESLTRHGDVILFSAATPGQGGTGHVNERPLEYWRELFANHGYSAFDFVRLQLNQNREIEPWYRYNAMLYASDMGQARLSDKIRATKVESNERLADFAPLSWRVRRRMLKHLPVSVVDKMASVNARLRALSNVRRV